MSTYYLTIYRDGRNIREARLTGDIYRKVKVSARNRCRYNGGTDWTLEGPDNVSHDAWASGVCRKRETV